MVMTLDFQYIGYMGLATIDFQNKEIQLDSALRGVKNIYPGLMTLVAKRLILFAYNTLKMKQVVGTAAEDNI